MKGGQKMTHKLYKNKLTILLMTFATMVVSLLAFVVGSTNLAYASAPAGYFNVLGDDDLNVVIGVDISSTFYIEDNGNEQLTDEPMDYLYITGGIYNNFPFLRSVEDRDVWNIQIWNGSSYDQLHDNSYSQGGYHHVTGLYTVGAWANGLVLTGDIESPWSPFFFAKSLGGGTVPVGSVPVISGWEGVYITNVNSPITLANLKNLIQAYDEEDGDVTSSIVVSVDNYTANMNSVGQYDIEFSASDSKNNVATLKLFVKVVDGTAPVITGSNTFNSYMSNPLTVADIKNTFTVSDNYDTLTTSMIVVKSDTFTTNKMTKGTYSVVYELQDTSGNKTSKTVSVVVQDDIKPVISGLATYTKGQNAVLTLDTIKAGLSATDNVDGNLTSSIVLVEDKYTSKGTTVGTWAVTYKVTDSSGNVSNIFTVNVSVTDTMPPVFYVDQSIMHIDSTLTLTHEEIIQILENTNQINSGMSYNASFIVDEYQGTQDEGHYNMSLRIDYADGNTQVINLGVNVINQEYTHTAEPEWYSSFDGWKSQWFGLRVVLNWVLGLLGFKTKI